MDAELKKSVHSALWGVALLFLAFLFWHHFAGNPFDELALIRHGQTVPGFIVDTWEEEGDNDGGGTSWLHGAVFTYTLPDGREFTQRTRDKPGRLKPDFRDLERPLPIEVQYLPDTPEVSRIKGEGSPNVFDWLWRKIGLGGLWLALLASPGVVMLRQAAREFMRYRQYTDVRNPNPAAHQS